MFKTNKFRFHIQRGFTLSEVLITLGIIGVIAAITLPSLQKSLTDQANITKLKKFYTIFTNTTNLIMEEEGPPVSWGLVNDNPATTDKLLEMYTSRLNVIKKCQRGDTSCFHFPFYRYNGAQSWTENHYKAYNSTSFVLNDGTTVLFDVNNKCFSVIFDVNGFKNPNRLGEDIFAFSVNGDGKIVDYNDPEVKSGSHPEFNYAYRIMKNNWKKDY